jgi:hypothetical protein
LKKTTLKERSTFEFPKGKTKNRPPVEKREKIFVLSREEEKAV